MTMCIVVRPLLFKGRRVEAGRQLDVDPAEAADLVSTTRARLQDLADLPAVEKARRDATVAALREGSRPPTWLERLR